MAITISALRDKIILDAGIEGNPNFPTLRLNKIINQAQAYVQTQLADLGFKRWETKQDITAGLASGSYAGSSNILKCPINSTYLTNILESPKSILFFEVTDESDYGIAYEIDPLEFQEQINNQFLAPTVKKPVFMRLANYIYFSPNDIAHAYAHYYKRVSDLDDTTRTITAATASGDSVSVTSSGHGLRVGDIITISSVSGMTDLNGEKTVVEITSADVFVVGCVTAQTYTSGGTFVLNSQIPVEFEEYIVNKAVIEIKSDLGQIDRDGQLAMLNAQMSSDYEKFLGKMQNLNFQRQFNKEK